ncbi:hypothetical protein B0T17DRAFT_495424 [Bombardia bombarda]|uniref:Small secreted protein n=1 Tax=Bombardia bombarda TaxID=252184 RepID=A0AA40BY74_9PEZI|nr:hypothetical protein B0T17DRAFT_495424 [Bombardia bombarda]
MYFSAAFLFSLVASTMALPTGSDSRNLAKRALSVQTYSQFQISGGVGGNALAEVKAKFPIDENNFAAVSASDLAILKAARQTAENAETKAGGFNEAIKAAGASTAAGKALQVGKIKNKVLKLKLFEMVLKIEAAQGKSNAADLADKQKKLTNNIALDKAAAGQTATSVDFQGSSQPKN